MCRAGSGQRWQYRQPTCKPKYYSSSLCLYFIVLQLPLLLWVTWVVWQTEANTILERGVTWARCVIVKRLHANTILGRGVTFVYILESRIPHSSHQAHATPSPRYAWLTAMVCAYLYMRDFTLLVYYTRTMRRSILIEAHFHNTLWLHRFHKTTQLPCHMCTTLDVELK